MAYGALSCRRVNDVARCDGLVHAPDEAWRPSLCDGALIHVSG
jgi:hypothetical protein